jgi:hypothetical protein
VASDVALVMLHWAILGNALHIAPAHRHGHRNGPRQRYIRSPPPPILAAVVLAKRPCYGPFKLTLNYYINLIGVICLCVSYWLPQATIDAVSATIVASGQAHVRLNKRLV